MWEARVPGLLPGLAAFGSVFRAGEENADI